MDYRVLGPLEVVDGARRVEIGPGKQRSVLAILLLNANQVVSTDRLVDELWGDRPPATAAKALQVYVSQLRKALGRETIVTRSPGYELQAPPGALDLDRFQRLREEAAAAADDPARAAALLGEALDAVARARPGGPGVRALRAGRGCPGRGAAARRAGGPARSAPGPRPAQRGRGRAGGGGPRPSHPGAAASRADARAVPVGPPGGRARGLSFRPRRARRGARDRAGARAARARARDPRAGPCARPAARSGAAASPAPRRRAAAALRARGAQDRDRALRRPRGLDGAGRHRGPGAHAGAAHPVLRRDGAGDRGHRRHRREVRGRCRHGGVRRPGRVRGSCRAGAACGAGHAAAPGRAVGPRADAARAACTPARSWWAAPTRVGRS